MKLDIQSDLEGSFDLLCWAVGLNLLMRLQVTHGSNQTGRAIDVDHISQSALSQMGQI